MDENLKIGILTQEGVPDSIWAAFLNHCHSPGTDDTKVHKRPPAPMAGILELMPAAIALYLAKPFFDSFLKNLGSDAYAQTKILLARTFSNTSNLSLTISASGKDKLKKSNSYSRVFSIHSNTNDGRPIKFLMPEHPTEEVSQEIIGSLIDEMAEYHAGSENSSILKVVSSSQSRGIMYLSYSFETKTWSEITTLDLLGK